MGTLGRSAAPHTLASWADAQQIISPPQPEPVVIDENPLLPKDVLEHLESGDRVGEFMAMSLEDSHSMGATMAAMNAMSRLNQTMYYSSYGIPLSAVYRNEEDSQSHDG